MSEVTKFEYTYKNKIYKITVSDINKPSSEAIKECNSVVNQLMNKLHNT